MRAMLLERQAPVEERPLRLRELADPEPGPHELRVRVHACAVCRTDLHVVEGDLPARKLPLVPGHQVVGVVDRVGPGARRLAPGQRVGIAWLRWTCGRCAYCREGSENLCPESRYTGYDADGGYAEYAIVHEDYAYPLPEAFADVEAAPLLCSGIIGFRALRRSRVPPAGRLALYGFGSSAHVVLQIARHRGCEVYVVTRAESHRQLARRLGAAWVGPAGARPPVPVDGAIVFAPAGEVVPAALQALRPGGTVALAGIHMTPVPELDYETCLFHEKTLTSVQANTREDGRDLLQEAAAIPVRPELTRFALEEANEALLRLKQDRLDGTGVLVVS